MPINPKHPKDPQEDRVPQRHDLRNRDEEADVDNTKVSSEARAEHEEMELSDEELEATLDDDELEEMSDEDDLRNGEGPDA